MEVLTKILDGVKWCTQRITTILVCILVIGTGWLLGEVLDLIGLVNFIDTY